MEVRQRRKKRVVPDKETDDQVLQQRDSKQDVEEEDTTEAEKRSPETDHGSQNDSWTLQLDGQLIALFIAACIMLFYRLDLPSDVVWDEVHFGKFASSYIKVASHAPLPASHSSLHRHLAALTSPNSESSSLTCIRRSASCCSRPWRRSADTRETSALRALETVCAYS